MYSSKIQVKLSFSSECKGAVYSEMSVYFYQSTCLRIPEECEHQCYDVMKLQ